MKEQQWAENVQQKAEKVSKEKYYVPKLIKELFWNLKVAQNDINDEGINHGFIKAQEKKTEHYSEKMRNKLLEEAKMQQKVNIKKFVQS